MYLEKIKSAYDNPTYPYAHNNALVGLEGILKEYKMEPEVKKELTNYREQISKASFYNAWTYQIDETKFREFNCLIYALFHYLKRFTFS